ncbi:MAG: uracil-DNA glycosylase [Poseidonibacter sp.]|uniref:uracil-DNA glycosylase n=1 Tax=Poseidonibacter sp. TaxID=2321188 RepID=UPI00359DDDF3
MNNRIVCQKCQYYYVTWEPANPHGCNAYGFKSKTIPSVVVKRSSNQDCSFFKQKNTQN